MESLRELYRIGRGPSSSHTMGPSHAAVLFRQEFPQADRFHATLYGSLAKTGRGHLTDVAIRDAFAPLPTEIVFDTETPEESLPHPNTLVLQAFQQERPLGQWRVFSVGGGKIQIEGQPAVAPQDVYPLSTFREIKEYCGRNGKFLWQFVEENEGPEIWDYLRDVWKQMKATVYAGLNTEGVLHGGLGVQRKAKYLVRQRHMDESPETRENRKVCAYAFAVSEENAGGGVVVTAPTCGASGVLRRCWSLSRSSWASPTGICSTPWRRRALWETSSKPTLHLRGGVRLPGRGGQRLLHGGGGPGGAVPHGPGPDRVRGRGGHGAPPGPDLRPHRRPGADPLHRTQRRSSGTCLDANIYATLSDGSHLVSYDKVVEVMNETGHNLPSLYRETSEGGLAKRYERK